VNTASRDAVVSPGASDTLAAFAGVYATHLLPAEAGEQVQPGAEIAITVNSQGARAQNLPRLIRRPARARTSRQACLGTLVTHMHAAGASGQQCCSLSCMQVTLQLPARGMGDGRPDRAAASHFCPFQEKKRF
jgi:hypothetical protein